MNSALPDAARLGEQLRQIAGLNRRFERKLGTALAVNSTDLSAMEHLIATGPMTPGDLAARLDVTSAAGTQVVDRLVAAGHVRRERQDDDRRRVTIIPAEESITRTLAELAPIIRGLGDIVDGLSAHDVDVVEAFLDRVIALYADASN